MKTASRIVLLSVTGILLLPTVCLCAPKVVKEFTLPALDGVHFRPRIYGDWIVSALNTTTSNNQSTIAIVGYNAKSGQNYTLFDGKGGWPEIDGSYVVWTGRSNLYETFRTLQGGSNGYSTASNLMMLDLNTRRYYSPRLRGNAAINVEIAGTVIAYRSGDHIYIIDMSTGITKEVTPAGSKPGVFAIGGDIVVWMDTDKKQIRCYRISTGEEFRISKGTADQKPSISGNKVIWCKEGKIYCAEIDLNAKTTRGK